MQDVDLAGMRGPVALARMPEEKGHEWKKQWREIEVPQRRAARPPEKRDWAGR
jgi:hypothetical protein